MSGTGEDNKKKGSCGFPTFEERNRFAEERLRKRRERELMEEDEKEKENTEKLRQNYLERTGRKEMKP